MTFIDRLESSIREKQNPCLVGLDPHLSMLPDEFSAARDESKSNEERAGAVGDFCCEVIDLVSEQAPAVKPQSAFFEVLGSAGAAAWERVVRHAKERGLIVIGDVKRGDIGSTSAAYARAFLDGDAPCDAITVNPYFGTDGLDPFFEVCRERGAGLYLLVRTSNPSSARLQLHGEPPLCEIVAQDTARWGEDHLGACGLSNIGAVVGATHTDELARLRSLMPKTPFLLPGYGAQGGGSSGLAAGFIDGTRGAIINNSRGLLFASKKPEYAGQSWQAALQSALSAMIADIGQALPV